MSTKEPTVPENTRVYAIGDVHGRTDLLGRLLGKIETDRAGAARGTRVTLVMLGDLVDRGPDSRGVLEMVAGLQGGDMELVCLTGNHEAMMLDFINDRPEAYDWLGNGGMEALESYSIKPHDRKISDLRDELREALPQSHLDLLKSMKMRKRIGGYLFVHAGIRPGVRLGNQVAEDMLWIRGSFLESTANFGFVVVHGHSIRAQPEIKENRIGIDTGAWMSGTLTALVLEGSERRFIST